MNDVLIEARGHNGQLELTNSVVRIKRKGLLAFMTQGLKGDKEILISQISSIQFKKANFIANGYIQIAFLGGQEAKGGIFQGTKDENTVMFTASQHAAFETFKDTLQKKMNSLSTKGSQSFTIDDLEKLAALRDKGIITDTEFQQKKSQLLAL